MALNATTEDIFKWLSDGGRFRLKTEAKTNGGVVFSPGEIVVLSGLDNIAKEGKPHYAFHFHSERDPEKRMYVYAHSVQDFELVL